MGRLFGATEAAAAAAAGRLFATDGVATDEWLLLATLLTGLGARSGWWLCCSGTDDDDDDGGGGGESGSVGDESATVATDDAAWC